MTARRTSLRRGPAVASLALAALLLAWCPALPLPAKDAQLGDPAPKLEVAEWVKGKPVSLSTGKGKNVFLIDFWGTFYDPCRMSVPRLTQIQAKYKDKGLVVIGITTEDSQTVGDYVKEADTAMGYSVAIDKTVDSANAKGESHHPTSEAYVGAFGVASMPHAFIVDKQGRIVWHGNTLGEEMESIVAQVLDGKFDLDLYKVELERKQKAARMIMQYFSAATSPSRKAEAQGLGEQILTDYADLPQPLNSLAYNILMANRVPDECRDLGLALRAARQANTAANNRPETLDTLAVALFKNGDKDGAIEMAHKAIEAAGENVDLKTQLEKHLALFKEPAPPAPTPTPTPASNKPADSKPTKTTAKNEDTRKSTEKKATEER